jgi:hypothetical protein
MVVGRFYRSPSFFSESGELLDWQTSGVIAPLSRGTVSDFESRWGRQTPSAIQAKSRKTATARLTSAASVQPADFANTAPLVP